MPYDVAVIGGGASGLAAAIAAARAGARTVVVERDVACGLSILATGNGRCNLSNADLDPARYRHPDAARAVMGPRPEADVAAFFDSLGLMTCDVDGRLYPITRRAESVRDVLLDAARRAGVELRCGCSVEGASREGSAWAIRLRVPERPPRVHHDASGKLDLRRARRALGAERLVEGEISAASVVVAVGGAPVLAREAFGLPYADGPAVLCPIACEEPAWDTDALRRLDGLRVEAALSLVRDGEELHAEAGEVLFRSYGISGIVAFDLSRRVRAGDEIQIDLFPGIPTGDLIGRFRVREEAVGTFDGRDAAWFDGVLARPLARTVLALAAADPSGISDGLRGDALTRCAKLCKRMPLTAIGLAEERQAQVRRGGVPMGVVDAATLAVHGIEGLHVCGEALDQDADCGGFNLAWAWLSGLRAGEAAARGAGAGR